MSKFTKSDGQSSLIGGKLPHHRRGEQPPLKRGVLLPFLKEPAASRQIANITPPSQIVMPLLSGDGSSCHLVAGNYDTVLIGSILGLPEQKDGCPVYAPVSGVISSQCSIMHPLLGDVACAVIDCMATGGEFGRKKPVDSLTSEAILELAFKKGIIDELDGQLLASKLASWRKGKHIMLIADGTEQEPYGSASWSVLNESAEQVRDGLALAARAMGAAGYHIAVKLSKKRHQKLSTMLNKDELISVHRKYPSKPAVHTSGAAICRIGVQSCLALYRAAAFDQPPCDCVVTVSGDAVANPQNVRVPFGTMVEDVLRFCGLAQDPEYVILGDAMTGITVQHTDIPVVPGITCILALKTRTQVPTHACIGCGRCVSACHKNLLPFEIMRRLDNMQYERLAPLLPEECDGCGVCSHVCPSGLDVTAKVLEARDAHGNIFVKWGDGDEF